MEAGRWMMEEKMKNELEEKDGTLMVREMRDGELVGREDMGRVNRGTQENEQK